jgi:ubiquitin-protein ligase
MNPRARRLLADFQKIEEAFAGSPYVWIARMEGSPPEKYLVVYKAPSLSLDAQGAAKRALEHHLQVTLPTGYPREPPHCAMLTPIFHPNIDAGAVCFGDHWAAEESLANLIGRIGEMITYQSYNTKAPLNPQAGLWTREHEKELPLATINFFSPQIPQIIVTLPSGKQGVFRIGIKGLIIGAKSGPGRLAIHGDANLSEDHCHIAPKFGSVTVRDLGSASGTTVDGVPVGPKPVVVSPNSLIQAASVTIKPKR